MKLVPGALPCLLMASVANFAAGAVIVVSSGQPASIAGEYDAVFYGDWSLDLDGDGAQDVAFSRHTLCTADIPTSACLAMLELSPRQGRELGYFPSDQLVAGALVGAQILQPTAPAQPPSWTFAPLSLSGRYENRRPPYDYSYQNPFGVEATDGYMAFRLPAAGEGWLYGYLHFDYRAWPLNQAGLPDRTGDPILVGWAYETTPDLPIRVRPIPEPTMMLLGLSGWVTVLGRRWRSRDRGST